ncbi:MAG: hypothetical protein H7249_13600 [Chitinophagaceae bacterium]|nr:hypothetical protein [Oligoflexus sp.]
MLELIPTILGAVAAALFVYAMITRKNWLETKALLTDTSIRYEAALQQSQKIEQNLKAQKDMMDKLRQQALKADRSAEDIKNKSSDGRLEILRLKTEYDAVMEKASSQKEHLLEQVQVLTQQLSEAVREKKQLADELSTLIRSVDDRARQMNEASRKELAEVQVQLSAARRERQGAESQLAKFKQESGLVKPEELKRWQLKVARLEQLYASMKGLREMAEERNENWETALRYFALHILGNKSPEATAEAANIGSLVGAALEKIGATLVDDDEGKTGEGFNLAPSSSELAADSLS